MSSCKRGHVAHERLETGGVERRDLAAALCEHVGDRVGLVDQRVDAGLIIEQGFEVPRDAPRQ